MPWLVYKHSLRSLKGEKWPWEKKEDLLPYLFDSQTAARVHATRFTLYEGSRTGRASYGLHYVNEAELAKLCEEIGAEIYPYEGD